MGHFIKDLVMNVSQERIDEVFIMVGRDFFREKNAYKIKVTGINCGQRAKDMFHFIPLKVNIIFTFTIVYSHIYYPGNYLCFQTHLMAVLQAA